VADDDDLELTPRERASLEQLGRERDPPMHLEDRIVATLRQEGVLRRVPWRRRTVPLPVAAAVGFILFGVGAFAGRSAPSPEEGASRVGTSPPATEPPADEILVVWM
jgi:hypothetical protein